MRSWLLGRSLTGAWFRLFVVALMPLFCTATVIAFFHAKAIPGHVRDESRPWVEINQALVDNIIVGFQEMAKGHGRLNEGRSAAEIKAEMLREFAQRPLLKGMAWVPDNGNPILTPTLEPIWPEVVQSLAESTEPLQLFPSARLGESLLLITERGETGRQVYILSLLELDRRLRISEDDLRWFALVDGDGFELAMHDPTVQMSNGPKVVWVRTPAMVAPGWQFIGYTSVERQLALAQKRLWWTIGLVMAALLTGLGLVLPAVISLLRPMRRLQQVAQVLPTPAAAASEMDLDQAAVVLVDRLEERLIYLEREHRQFFVGSDVPFVIVTWDGWVVEVNQAWCRLIGYPEEYFRDHKVSDTLHPDERFHVRSATPELRTVRMTSNWLWHHVTATGEDLWIAWSTTSDPENQLYYGVGRNVTAEHIHERDRSLQAEAARLWLVAKSGERVQVLLDLVIQSLAEFFPTALFAVWEEPANGQWLLRAGTESVHPEKTAAFAREIPGELVRFGLLVGESNRTFMPEEVTFLETLAEMISTAVKLELESVRLMIQHGVNQLLADAESVSDISVRLLPLISRPMQGIAARLWAPSGEGQFRLLADWAEPGYQVNEQVYALHEWMVQRTLADGHPRWIAEGTRLPHRPDEAMPVGRITFALRVGARVVGCMDCLVAVLRTPEAGFLTLLDSVGAQIGLYMERRRAEEERRQQALLATGRGDVMDLVGSGAPLESVLDRICRLAESLLPDIWTLTVFYDAKPDRPLILLGPSCPPERMAQFKEFLLRPGAHDRLRRWQAQTYLGSQSDILTTMPVFGPALVEMGTKACWMSPISIPPSDGTLLFGYYTDVEGGFLEGAEKVLMEVSHLAQMAVERWWLEEAMTRRVDLLLEHMQEGLVAVDSKAEVVQTNPAARKVLQLPRFGRNSPGDLPEPLMEAFRRAIMPGTQPFPVTMTVNGAPVYAYLSPVRSEEGALLGAIAILEDSTLRQRFQQLQTSLVANVSHDLKAPLAALGALVETLADQELPPKEQQQYLGSMRNEIARLRRMTQDLLLLARLDAGLLTLEPEVLAMDDLLRGLAETWAPRCQAHGITLTVTGQPIEAWADYDRVIQILTNLLDNAVKFTPEGGEIQLGVEAVAAGRMRLFVRDTGLGIAPEHIERLGSRFYMVDPARERTNATGTGLGLSIVRSLAELMDGQIRIESIEGGGTTIWLDLPRPLVQL